MKKSFLSLFLVSIIYSCNHSQRKEWDEKCVVKNVNEHVRHGGLINERSYTIKTGCGYTIISKKHANVGDTINVHVISYRAHTDTILK
jgi:hypothetical protein